MKKFLLLTILLINPLEEISVFASEVQIHRKGGRYRKKKHRLKKFFMGKRYCECPGVK
ncbi:MAG: hypothetical protein ACRCVT_07215 [Leadbetterella sp.]